MAPDPALVARFAADLDPLVAPGEPIGVAVSGGPDSVALLLLASAVRPGSVMAATVDHGLRPESREEAEMVARICREANVPHRILPLVWNEPPKSALQEKARDRRYAALAEWARNEGLALVATGHHADDQVETLLMRLARGAGVRGLAAMRPTSPFPGDPFLTLVRPLLGWRRDELAEVCASAEISPAHDTSNSDDQFERVRVRRLLAATDFLDPLKVGRSAAHLAAADEALEWAAGRESVERDDGVLRYTPGDAPPEIRRRVLARILAEIGSEGSGQPLRGNEVDRLLSTLESGEAATLRGVVCRGASATWTFEKAPSRRS